MRIFWLEKAAVDMDELYEFISRENPAAAGYEIEKIFAAVERLSSNPGMGKAGRVSQTRELVIAQTPYIVIYRVEKNRLEILRILHGARRWPENRR